MEHILSPRSPHEQLKRLKTVPKELYPAYNSVIERIESGREGDAEVAMRTISWIYRSRRTLVIDELLEALAVDEYFQDVSGEGVGENLDCILENKLTPPEIVEICNGLVLYEEPCGSVRFSHETVNGFIENVLKQKSQFPPSTRLSKTCLIYLGLVGSDGPCKNNRVLRQRSKKYKFGQYAAQFWGLHTRGEAENNPDIQRAVLSLLASETRRTRCCNWTNMRIRFGAILSCSRKDRHYFTLSPRTG